MQHRYTREILEPSHHFDPAWGSNWGYSDSSRNQITVVRQVPMSPESTAV